ncbi:MAG: hypothetical protein ACRCUI_06085 [Polymorphobacter sp.]
MANALYAVVIDGAGWRISHNGQLFARDPSEAAAVSAARETAQAAVAAGFAARVVVEGAGGGFRIDWNSADAAT